MAKFKVKISFDVEMEEGTPRKVCSPKEFEGKLPDKVTLRKAIKEWYYEAITNYDLPLCLYGNYVPEDPGYLGKRKNIKIVVEDDI